ncbi:histone H3.v1 isoform X3 [Nilaparvata lugens]|uniref:histone H3.v1 isoform X3 n=1 Tax=Nilaparvata lugens TaxID=108931 RepID=UPI00193D7E06|nr:histone H3.v1 isoform X3 [Nilaparvata lugens]
MERAECNEVWIKNEFNELENKDASSISSEDSYSKTIGENQVTDDEENLENNNLRQNFENEEEEEEEVGGEAKENNDYEIREEKWEEEVKEEEEDEAGNEDDEREGDIEEKTDIPDVLYPNILIENGSPIKLVDDLQEDLLNNLKPNENDDLAKAGVLIHCTKCKIILTSNAALLDHRKICSAVPYPMEKPPTPVITYPEFCDGRLANPKPTVRKRIRNKNKPKTQQKAALFEIRDGLFWCTQCSYKTATAAYGITAAPTRSGWPASSATCAPTAAPSHVTWSGTCARTRASGHSGVRSATTSAPVCPTSNDTPCVTPANCPMPARNAISDVPESEPWKSTSEHTINRSPTSVSCVLAPSQRLQVSRGMKECMLGISCVTNVTTGAAKSIC